eukprot:TRINITY_DN997_c0_g2_i1.p1 TRINITY_DN997_c0_g2~~TRINITY_DN997_c0_g2_i1.p1  ORF type:complete len:271 (-),score=97.98 TRINITY_DN997_c0_g2_i1:309-1121(-)
MDTTENVNTTTTIDMGKEKQDAKKPSQWVSFKESLFPEEGVHRSSLGVANWLRAAVLGANDAIVSVASVMIGVAANTNSSNGAVMVAGLAALWAGALSMAVGEYVSVCSQKDLEEADLKLEMEHLKNNPHGEFEELVEIYIERGVHPETAKEVARQLMDKDPLTAHAWDELGIRDFSKARPWSAGFASFFCFMVFGTIPFLAGAFIQNRWAQIGVLASVSLILLFISGIIGAYFGGAPLMRGGLRVTVGGAIAMAITAGVGFATEAMGIN